MQHIQKSPGLSEERSGSVVEYVLDLASKDRYIYFETRRTALCLLSTGSTQQDRNMFQHD